MKILRIIIVAFMLMLYVSVPVFAMSSPSSIEITTLDVFQNIFTDGDWVIVVRYDISFASTPTELSTGTYGLFLYDGAVAEAMIPLPAYGHKVAAIVLTAAQVAAKGLVWEGAYTVKLMPLPAYTGLPEAIALTVGNYTTGDQATSRVLLGAWLVENMYAIEQDTGTTYTTIVSGVRKINSAGTDIIDVGMPGVSTVTNVYEYSVSAITIERESMDRIAAEAIEGYITITQAEDTVGFTGTSVNNTHVRTEGNFAIMNTVASPAAAGTYSLVLDLDGTWDLSKCQEFSLDIMNSRHSNNFTSARFYRYDVAGNWAYWNIPLISNDWTRLYTTNLTGDVHSGVAPSLVTQNVSWVFVSADVIPFYFYIDNVKAFNTSGMAGGTHVQSAKRGLAELFGTSPEMIGLVIGSMLVGVLITTIALVTGNPGLSIVLGISYGVPVASFYWGLISPEWYFSIVFIITAICGLIYVPRMLR